MKRLSYLIMGILLVHLSCTKESTLFEKSTWWDGHWQNMDDPSYFFSVGAKPIGLNEIITPQFFISTRDSIYSNFYVETLIDSDHKKRFKLLKTSDGTYLKIQEIEAEHIIRVHGPTKTIKELDSKVAYYRNLPESVAPPFPDSVLYPD